MNKKLILTSIIIFFTNMMIAQVPDIQWQKALGGNFTDRAYCVQLTLDGGYILSGYANSNNGDVINNPAGNLNCWIVKLNSNGSIQWQKSFEDANPYSIQQTSDGGYIVGGSNFPSSGHGYYDYMILKLSNNGTVQWRKNIGGSRYDDAYSIWQSTDGGYIVAGKSNSNDGDVTGNHDLFNAPDYWIVKLNSTGIIEWQKCLGGTGSEYAYAIQQTADGGYIVAGSSDSNDGDVAENNGGSDYWIVKLSNNGTIQWEKSLGGAGNDTAYSIQQTSDGGYIVAGESYFNGKDVTGNHGGYDYWVVKLDNIGSIQWQKSLGGSLNERAKSVQQTLDGGYIISGYSESNDGDVLGNHGGEDFWIVKLDSNGILQWQKPLGGSKRDFAYSIKQTSDQGYIIAGYTGSNDGDVLGNHGIEDYWVVKLYPENLNIDETSLKNIIFVENPIKDHLKINSKEKITSLQLYNAAGQLVKTANSQNMSVKELSKGIYILKIQLENDKVISEKIVKE